MLEYLFNSKLQQFTSIGYFGYIILFCTVVIIILIILLATGAFCSGCDIGYVKSPFSSPETNVSRNQSIEIEPLNMAHEPFNIGVEPFNNDLPNPDVKLTNNINPDDLMESNKDYSDIIASEALEQGVFEQHKAYVNEKNKVTNTASRNPARSDSQDLIPFVGLRRPQYQIEGRDMVDASARQVPSIIDANQLAKPTNLRWD